MNTEVLAIESGGPAAAPLARAGQTLRRGGLVAFPTETVYGLGANALDAQAVERIFAAKGRPAANPVIVHIADLADVMRVVGEWPEVAERLAAHFWPGPLTLVLRKAAAVPDAVTAGGPTVGVRMPAHRVAHELIRAAAVPVAAPSANRSTRISPTSAAHVLADLAGRIDLVLDGGPTPGGLESTVIDLTTSPPRLLRPGLIAPAQIEAIAGAIDVPTRYATRAASATPSGPLRSPGLTERHYAPAVPLECAASESGRIIELCRQGMRVGWLTLAGRERQCPPNALQTELPADPAGYAAGLYAALHAFENQAVDRIVVELPPATEDWLAIHDRLRRASTPAES
ncbi:MAG TPA: L-threonylcarbamoyladenylate synthase [Pirellulales bacterium]|nr:L-threonylcarbamoyladenylate synthase [Pirellulales bacterium]